MSGLSKERLDVVREQASEFEGMSVKEIGVESSLYLFLGKVCREYMSNGSLKNIEDASIIVLEKMSESEREGLTQVVNDHFNKHICLHPDGEVVNCDINDNLAEGSVLVTFVLNKNNLQLFFGDKNGQKSLLAHIEWFLGKSEWENFRNLEASRIMDFDRHVGQGVG